MAARNVCRRRALLLRCLSSSSLLLNPPHYFKTLTTPTTTSPFSSSSSLLRRSFCSKSEWTEGWEKRSPVFYRFYRFFWNEPKSESKSESALELESESESEEEPDDYDYDSHFCYLKSESDLNNSLSKVQYDGLPAIFFYYDTDCTDYINVEINNYSFTRLGMMGKKYPYATIYGIDVSQVFDDQEDLEGKLSNLGISDLPAIHFYHNGKRVD